MTTFVKSYQFIKKPWVAVLWLILVIVSYFYLDKAIASYFYSLDLRTSLPILNLLTALGKWAPYTVLFISGGLYFRFIRKNKHFENYSWYLLSCVLVPNILGTFLKVLLSRARPELLFSSQSYGFYWMHWDKMYWSFPSGHTITIVSLACSLGVLIPRYFSIFIVIALAISLSRVVLYHHYMSDVLFSFYFSMYIVGYITVYCKKNHIFIR